VFNIDVEPCLSARARRCFPHGRSRANVARKRDSHWTKFLVVTVLLLWSCTAETTEYIALHLYQEVEFSDAIVIATVTDVANATVRVEQTLKGSTPRSIHIVDYIDGFMRPADQRPLVRGTRELMFLKATEDGYAPLQTQFGRWLSHGGSVEAPRQIAQLGLPDFRKTILQLVDLQSRAAVGGSRAIDAYVEALQAADPHVRLWAADSAYQQVNQPSPRLVDAYLKLWSTRDGEMRGSTANAVIKWKIRDAAPMLAATLREASDWGDRATAARALGGTGDLSFLPLLRTTATSDESDKVRGWAYEGLAELLGRESIPDLERGSKDRSEFVRRSVAIHAFNMANHSTDAYLRADVRKLLMLLAEDTDRSVKQTVQSFLKQLANP
jgi:hypothetical protein